jgi:hypothetical protein
MSAEMGSAHPVDRRALIRAAAWSMPVVALAVAAPTAVASTTSVGDVIVTGSCYLHTDTSYSVERRFRFTILAAAGAEIPAGSMLRWRWDGADVDNSAFNWIIGINDVTQLSSTSGRTFREVVYSLNSPISVAKEVLVWFNARRYPWTGSFSLELPTGWSFGPGAIPSAVVTDAAVCSA